MVAILDVQNGRLKDVFFSISEHLGDPILMPKAKPILYGPGIRWYRV